jgi:LmbE family N-acetylglucosaminyl deacetylase
MRYRNIIISPHIDDAFFSLGGLLLKDRGKRQKVVDIFSISGFHKLKLNDVKKVTQIRRREEMINAKRLGVDVDFLPFRDREEAKSGGEAKLAERIRRSLARYVREGDRIFFPLAIGDHADHNLVSRIALGMLKSAGGRIYFYEDLPYAMKTTLLWRFIRPFVNFRNSAPTFPLIDTRAHAADLECEYTPIDLNGKLDLCRAYESQTTIKILLSIIYYGLTLGSRERVWRVKNYTYAESLLKRRK